MIGEETGPICRAPRVCWAGLWVWAGLCCVGLAGKTLLAKNGCNLPKFVVTWYKFTFTVPGFRSTPITTTI